MRTIAILILLSNFFGSELSAQNGTIKGTVKDNTTGETLIGVNIVYAEGKGTVTDIDGNYSINLPYGDYTLKVSYVGYKTEEKTINLNSSLARVDFLMKTTMLSEVQVVADLASTRQTPVAFTNITPLQLEEELAAQDLPMILNRTPGVYATQQGGGDGDARINIRGFSQRNVAVMLDGIPVNDMENGWVYWSNWFGLDAVTRTIQVQRGLGKSKLAIPSVGGTINIITKGITAKKGINLKQEVGNDGYLRTSLGITTGRMNKGWGVTFAGSYKSGDGWVDQNWTEGWFYFLRVDKKVGNHIISLSALGAPQQHGQRSYKKAIAVYDAEYAKDLGIDVDTFATLGIPFDKGLRYNSHWGYLEKYTLNANGDTIHNDREEINTRKNYYHKPMFSLRDFWKLNDKLYISNIAYLSIGNGGGTRLSSTPNPTGGQVNLQTIYDNNYINRNNPQLAGHGDAITSLFNNHFWYGLLSQFTYEANDLFTYSGGIDLRSYKGEHYGEVYDLLGAHLYIDEIDQTELIDKTNPSVKRYVGDKINYNNDALVKWSGLFLQVELKRGNLTTFANISASYSGYKRIDYFKKKDLVLDDTTMLMELGYWRDYDLSSGDWISIPDTTIHKGKIYTVNSKEARDAQTDWKWYPGFTLKWGANYNVSERSNVFFNIGYISKAPRFNNVYDRSNNLFSKIRNEKVNAIELGYSYHTSKMTLNANAYYTKWFNKPADFVVSYTDTNDNRISGNINGMDALHTGVEVEFGYRIMNNLFSESVIAVGDWTWTSGDSVRFYDENTQALVESYYFNADGVHVGDAAQIQLRESIRWEVIKDLYIKGSVTYFSKHYSNFDPLSLSPDYLYAPTDYVFLDTDGKPKDSWKIPNYYLIDLHAGYSFNLKKVRVYFRVSVLNLLNRVYISDAQNNDRFLDLKYNSFDARSAGVFYGMGRRFNSSVKFVF